MPAPEWNEIPLKLKGVPGICWIKVPHATPMRDVHQAIIDAGDQLRASYTGEPVHAELRRAVRTAWMSGVDNFREKYDDDLFRHLGINHFQDMYDK